MAGARKPVRQKYIKRNSASFTVRYKIGLAGHRCNSRSKKRAVIALWLASVKGFLKPGTSRNKNKEYSGVMYEEERFQHFAIVKVQ
jgi:hypothetical protein